MLIIGAKGFAKEVLEILNQLSQIDDLVFFDDISTDNNDKLYDKFKIINNIEDAKYYIENVDSKYALGIGNPKNRKLLYDKFESFGGKLISVISPFARIGNYGNLIENGCNIMTGTVITNDIKIGKGCLINLNCTIGHDSVLEDFVELSPNVNISGNCRIGAYTSLGTNSVLIPNIKVGKNCVVAAGSIVTKDVPDNCLVAGVPAVIKKTSIPFLDKKS